MFVASFLTVKTKSTSPKEQVFQFKTAVHLLRGWHVAFNCGTTLEPAQATPPFQALLILLLDLEAVEESTPKRQSNCKAPSRSEDQGRRLSAEYSRNGWMIRDKGGSCLNMKPIIIGFKSSGTSLGGKRIVRKISAAYRDCLMNSIAAKT